MQARRTIPLFAAALAMSLLAGSAAANPFRNKGIEGSGKMETRTFDVKDFDSIDIGGSFAIDVSFGDKQDVKVTIDDNLWENLEIEVHGRELVVNWDDSCRPDDDCRLEVVVPSLKEMSISGAAEVDIRKFAGERFKFHLSGAAELAMSGKVDDLDIQVDGAGEIDTRDLEARRVKVRISGAGNANITAFESLDAEVSGVGNIEYWGNPGEKKTSVSGLGSIKSR